MTVLVGSIFNKARRRRDEAFQSSGKAINEKVRLYARIGQALLAAKEDGADPFAAIEKTVPWVGFRTDGLRGGAVVAARRLRFSRPYLEWFSADARYTPAMLDIFEFRAAPAASTLAGGCPHPSRDESGQSRSVPQNAPLRGSTSAGARM